MEVTIEGTVDVDVELDDLEGARDEIDAELLTAAQLQAGPHVTVESVLTWDGDMSTAARKEFLADIIVAAVEGGTGYWAQVSAYKHSGSVDEVHAVLHETKDDESGYKEKGMRLDAGAVERGIDLISRGKIDVSAPTHDAICGASMRGDAGSIDSDLADIIAQAALLGEIVYG